MLVLSRRLDEKIVIGDDIILTILEVRDGRVKLGFEAPDNVKIWREEVYGNINRHQESGQTRATS